MGQLKSLIVMLLLSISFIGFGQGETSKIDPEAFNQDLFISLLKKRLHEARAKQNADSFVYHSIVMQAAQDQADWMAANKKEGVEQVENANKLSTMLRIAAYGGTTDDRVAENVKSVKFARGNTMFTYKAVLDELFKKWGKKKDIISSWSQSSFVYSGIGINFAKDENKIYVSHVMTEMGSINAGAQYRKQLSAPYGKSKKGLVPYDEVACEDVKTFKQFNQLQEGLYVKDGKVFMKYNDINTVMDLMVEPKDGFAVDFVQRDQYPCDKDNIYDKNLMTKGILIKPLYQKKMFAKNQGGDEALDVMVGKFPKKITGEYEMNLLVIKNKSICNTVKRSFIEIKDVKSQNEVEIVPDTIKIVIDTLVTPGQERYKVGYEDKTLNFIIPFEHNKSKYKKEDMKPFIEALDEPHFIIHKITFYAHSSIEGSEKINERLREKRGRSIVKAMEAFQDKDIDAKIIHDDSWNMFRKQVQGTEFEYLASKSLAEVKKILATNRKLRRKIEPILSEERFARIVMFVTVDDIQGMQEEKYLKKKINKAIEEDDYEKALKTQRFIIENVLSGVYEYTTILDQEFPWEQEYASLILNQIWAKNFFENEGLFTQDLAHMFDSLYTLAPNNPYAAYNKLLCDIKNQKWSTKNDMDSLQIKIDALYSMAGMESIDKWQAWVNQLNIEFQFAVLDWYEKSNKLNKIVQNTVMNKVSKAFDPENSSWKLSMKVAVLFGKYKRYKRALAALEPYVKNVDLESGEVNEELLFTYVIISAQKNNGTYTKDFREALGNARLVNKNRYCNLFGAPYLSFQMLDDPLIKNTYCATCNSIEAEETSGEEAPAEEAPAEEVPAEETPAEDK